MITPTELYNAEWSEIDQDFFAPDDLLKATEIFLWTLSDEKDDKEKRTLTCIQITGDQGYYVVVRDKEENLIKVWEVLGFDH